MAKERQLVIPGIPELPRNGSIVFRVSPNSKVYLMLMYLAIGYKLSPTEFLRRFIASAFEHQVNEWGYDYAKLKQS